jgi:alpha-amylase/alpha-mannosidase (GH57 family)
VRHPLHVAFFWHMHQPDYSHPRTGEYSLPWVRLHAAKDYLRMAELQAQYPKVRSTVNFVPSLLAQIEAYAEGTAQDRALAISTQTKWTREEKSYILSLFFSVNEHKVLWRSPRYLELKARRDATQSNVDSFSDADYLDIIALFNLSWMDSVELKHDDAFLGVALKGAGYSPEDIRLILAKQREVIAGIIPAYRTLSAQRQVEVTTSPYYHPVLPLLVNTDAAKISMPGMPLPSPALVAPEDAREQLSRAVQSHAQRFGKKPAGLWPPEGAVGAALVPMIAEAGFRWFASDETILARSLGVRIERDSAGHVKNPAILYQPYWVDGGGKRVAVIFRDHALSDRIGFVYQSMDPHAAADDMIRCLHIIRERLDGDDLPYLVPIILDGENAWEFYEQNGNPFLRALYQRLSDDPLLEAVNVSEHLRKHPPRARVERLFTGSWINGNLDTWIGEEKHNRAWVWLAQTRRRLVDWEIAHPEAPRTLVSEAWERIYQAEGSDWFWWYSSRNWSPTEAEFDDLYRARLLEVYRMIGETPPSDLAAPGGTPHLRENVIPFIQSAASGWPEAAAWDRSLTLTPSMASQGAAQRAFVPVRRLRIHRDEQSLHLRLETYEPIDGQGIVVEIWPGGDTSQNPWNAHLSGAQSPEDMVDLKIRRGFHDASLSVPIAPLGVGGLRSIALRVGLLGQDRENCWVPGESPALLLLDSGQS